MNTRQAAAFLGISLNHLRNLHQQLDGPKCKRVFKGNVLTNEYTEEDLREWARSRVWRRNSLADKFGARREK